MTLHDETGRYIGGRPEPPVRGSEAETLLGFLHRQRATFAWKVGGLDADELNATHAPSSMTLGGMIRHLTRFEDDMSTEWLRGEAQIAPWDAVDWDATHDADWREAAGIDPATLRADWNAAVDRATARFTETLAGADLGGPGGASDALPSLRYVLLNMIEEYARHVGQADLLREAIDGLTGQDPSET